MSVLLGVRTEAELLYRDELEALAREQARFRFVPTLSRGADEWRGRRGYVQTHLAEVLDDLAPIASEGAARDVDVYVCGLTRMIKEVRRIARDELHVPRERVHVERYD
ncbi:MAG: hypothetical protein ACHREM_27365 [Polyangiales bacterium]